jgi:hypothetical protein
MVIVDINNRNILTELDLETDKFYVANKIYKDDSTDNIGNKSKSHIGYEIYALSQ